MSPEKVKEQTQEFMAKQQAHFEAQHATPTFAFGVIRDPAPGKGRFAVTWVKDGIPLEEVYLHLSAMQEAIAERLKAA